MQPAPRRLNPRASVRLYEHVHALYVPKHPAHISKLPPGTAAEVAPNTKRDCSAAVSRDVLCSSDETVIVSLVMRLLEECVLKG
jgi:hypothetical protein